jgi:hypothetical protein
MYSDKYFKKKYFKYKIKYLRLKNTYLNIEMKGGGKPVLTNDNINLFNLFNPTIESHIMMEPYLNPIYGLYMCEIGFIINNYYLYKTFRDLTLNYARKIYNIITVNKATGTFLPTNTIFTNITPQIIGGYIALLYICKNNKDFIKNVQHKGLKVLKLFKPEKLSKENQKTLEDGIKTLQMYVDSAILINQFFPINESHNIDDLDFHIILYCLWNVLDNKIEDYYIGINEVINICNFFLSLIKSPVKYEPIYLTYKNTETDTFEKIIFDITKKNFYIFEMEWAKHFCSSANGTQYRDCGEITARNFINLICFDPETNEFSITILQKYNAIPQLIEYYRVFNTFEKQLGVLMNIYEHDLNARDAWSKLIIYFANYNLRFKGHCNNGYPYELADGMATNGKTTNFFQLIHNLLQGIGKLDDLNSDMLQIYSNTDETGFGKIMIESKIYSNITIYCSSGHYEMIIDKTDRTDEYEYRKLSDNHKSKIHILLSEDIDIDNYFLIDWQLDTHLIVRKIKRAKIELKKKLLELSFTDLFNSNIRMQIEIDAKTPLFAHFANMVKVDNKVNEYTYKSNNFEFIIELPTLTHLNCVITDSQIISIDLDYLLQIVSIGNTFLNGYRYLEIVKITDSSIKFNITTIGHGFICNCINLKNIDLTFLSELTSIVDGFLSRCISLEEITLTHLSKVISIGNDFLSDTKLQKIDLTSLSNVKSIGDDFLFECKELKEIIFPSVLNITSINNNFLAECSELTEINLDSLSNVTSIGNNFLSLCTNLKNINLRSPLKLKSVGYNFLYKCTSLKFINGEPIPEGALLDKYIFELVK